VGDSLFQQAAEQETPTLGGSAFEAKDKLVQIGLKLDVRYTALMGR
jgi:hypothetical protein